MAATVGAPWRGNQWNYWYKVAPQIPRIRRTIQIYLGETPLQLERRDETLLLLMQILDEFKPSLNDAEALAAIRYQRRPPMLPALETTHVQHSFPVFMGTVAPHSPFIDADAKILQGSVFVDPINRDPIDTQYLMTGALGILHGQASLIPATPATLTKLVVDDDAFKSILGDENNSGITAVNLELYRGKCADTQPYQCSRKGTPMPYRGHGPVWSRSCHVDCCIVAARLMNLGSTIADVSMGDKLDWLQSLRPIQRAFLQVVELPWESMTLMANIEQRDHFMQKYHARRSELGKGGGPCSMQSANDAWSICTEGFGQFEYTTSQRVICDVCGTTPSLTPHHPSSRKWMLELRALNVQEARIRGCVSIADRLRQHFTSRVSRCPHSHCKGLAWKRTIVDGTLPHRLAVSTPTLSNVGGGSLEQIDRSIMNSTSDNIKVQYHNEEGDQTAHYRWIGGIYGHDRHFRLYWSDHNFSKSKRLMVYDGTRCSGSIIGGISPFSSQELIPPAWSKGSDVLFFERICHPETRTEIRLGKDQVHSAQERQKNADLEGRFDPIATRPRAPSSQGRSTAPMVTVEEDFKTIADLQEIGKRQGSKCAYLYASVTSEEEEFETMSVDI